MRSRKLIATVMLFSVALVLNHAATGMTRIFVTAGALGIGCDVDSELHHGGQAWTERGSADSLVRDFHAM